MSFKHIEKMKRNFDKLSDEEIEFAMNYPIQKIIDYSRGVLNEESSKEIDMLRNKNCVLNNLVCNISSIVSHSNIQTEQQYDKYLAAKFHAE